MKYHYTYRLIAQNPIDSRVEYIGVRSSDCHPDNDGSYLSSSRAVAVAVSAGVVFVKEIIAVWPSRKSAVEHEVKLHAEFDVARSDLFFNRARQTKTSFDVAGTKSSAELRSYLSAAHKKRLASPSERKRISTTAKAVADRPGQRQKMSEAARKYWDSACPSDHGAKIRVGLTAAVRERKRLAMLTPEFRVKNSMRNKIAWSNPDLRVAMSANAKARMANPEVRKNLSDWALRQMSDPVKRKKWAAALNAKMSDPEVRSRISAAAKRQFADNKNRAITAESQRVAQSIKREYFKVSGYSGDKRKVTLSEAKEWLSANCKGAD